MGSQFSEIYQTIETKEIPECGGTGRVYEHRKTGARIFTLKNQDKNKTFYIAFRTKPEDDTGVAHILEHSVLCGSGKFPLKDPFVELAKGSLNTFLNAMTYPDKTVYPVASCNERDFMNLVDVYMDAVLHPNIYREKKIFEQEGWHYELSEDGTLSYNGVVYNEMKGAFSSAESVLERSTMHALFPDTTYGVESGGDPDAIPSLDYETFLKFHETYYHPSNAYLYLYGDMDMEEKLLWLDEHYLSAYERREIASEITRQPALSGPLTSEISYPLGAQEEEAGRCYFSENYVVPGELDPVLYIAGQILEFVLLDAPGAPLKEALRKAGIGEDIFGGYSSGILQPYFSVIAKNADAEDEARFHEVIRDTLQALSGGIDRAFLEAALNFTEFKYREADYGRTPSGLMYGLIALDSWLYGGAPYLHLCYEKSFAYLREQMANGYFERLISEWFLENRHSAFLTARPKRGLSEQREQALSEKLAALKAELSEEQLSGIAKEEQALRAYQEAEDPEASVASLPQLSISDIEPAAEKNCMKVLDQGKLLWSDFRTNGISYIRVLFDTKDLAEEELQFLSFLCSLYGELDTRTRSYQALTNDILSKTGGLDFDLSVYPDSKTPGAYQAYFYAELRVLSEYTEDGLSLVSEILNETLFADETRIGEKLLETKSRVQARIERASHAAAVTRLGSYYRADQRYADLTDGIAYYDFLNAAAKFYRIPAKRHRFIASLEKTARKLLTKKNMCIALSGGKEEKRRLREALPAFRKAFAAAKPAHPLNEAEESERKRHAVKAQGRLNEGFRTTSGVNYVARGGSFAEADLPYTGRLLALRGLLNYEYLWQNLRVKGGAYGCMSGFTRSGRGYLVSYRDPQLEKTNAVYEALPEYLSALSLPEREITKYIIGAVAVLDQPSSASVKAAQYLSAYLCRITDEDLQRERDELLSSTEASLCALSAYAKEVLAADYLCVIGNAAQINAQGKLFSSIRDLF